MITFANPWGLLALLAVPVILAIHLFRRRYPPRPVAGLFLWAGARHVREAGRVADRLPLSTSLFLELLAALLLALVLAQPRLSWGRVPHLVVVLDGSASMGARLVSGGTVGEKAITSIGRRMEEMGRNAVVSVITTGRRPAMIAGPAADWERTKRRLDDWQPISTHHSPASAWDLAAQLAGDEAELLFLTDALPEESLAVPARMDVVALGEANPNFTIASARWSVEAFGDHGEILGHVANHSNTAAEASVTAIADGGREFRQTISVPAGATRPFRGEVAAGLGRIQLNLSTPADHLAIDDAASLVEPRPRMVRVAGALPADHPAAAPLKRAVSAIGAARFVEGGNADLIVTSHTASAPNDPNAWWLAIGTATRPAGEAAEKSETPIVVDGESPLLDGVTFDGVIASGTGPLAHGGTALISRGDTPLLVRRNDTSSAAYVLNIDFASSNLAKSPDWPILLSNLVSLIRRDLPGLDRWNYRTGESVTLRLLRGSETASDNADETLVLKSPFESASLRRGGDSVVTTPVLESPGVYEIRGHGETLASFAVNFHDARESDLLTRETGSLLARRSENVAGTRLDSFNSWLTTLAILLVISGLIVNWSMLSRSLRRTRPIV